MSRTGSPGSGESAVGLLALGGGFGAGKARERFVRSTQEYKSAVEAYEGARDEYTAAQLRLDLYQEKLSEKINAAREEYIRTYGTPYSERSALDGVERPQYRDYDYRLGLQSNEDQYLTLRTQKIMLDADPQLKQLIADRDAAFKEFDEYHQHLIETTTRVGTAEAEGSTSGFLTGRRGGSIRTNTETEEVSQTHAHDRRWFDLKEKYEKAEADCKVRTEEILKTEDPMARAQAVKEVDAMRKESGVLATDIDAARPEKSSFFDWDKIDHAAGIPGFIPPWVWVVGGFLIAGISAAALASVSEKRSQN